MEEWLKRRAIGRATQISVSHAIADDLPGSSIVIGNCYDDRQFRRLEGIDRKNDLVFLGRLVSDKGADLAIQAVGRLRLEGIEAGLSIIGEGADRPDLQSLCRELGVQDLVRFQGIVRGEDLVTSLNEHAVLVIPSRWNEPFGIVALEGIACGCVPVGSEGGGLREAIGPCGLVFKNGDLDALVSCLKLLLLSPELQDTYRARATKHLTDHQSRQVAARYLVVLEEAIR